MSSPRPIRAARPGGKRRPEMAECPARAALDDGLSAILGLPELRPLRRMLASEPVVSNRRL